MPSISPSPTHAGRHAGRFDLARAVYPCLGSGALTWRCREDQGIHRPHIAATSRRDAETVMSGIETRIKLRAQTQAAGRRLVEETRLLTPTRPEGRASAGPFPYGCPRGAMDRVFTGRGQCRARNEEPNAGRVAVVRDVAGGLQPQQFRAAGTQRPDRLGRYRWRQAGLAGGQAGGRTLTARRRRHPADGQVDHRISLSPAPAGT